MWRNRELVYPNFKFLVVFATAVLGAAERLRYALNELGVDILKETYSQRRKVAL